jgi:predicted nucleotidyltransferase component of viral defense system
MAKRTLRLSLCRLDRHHSPVMMDVGPVMSIDDLVATKVAALVNRREVRDYIDVAAALRTYSIDQLLALAHEQDPGLEDEDVVLVSRYLDRLDDSRFDTYGLSPGQVQNLRQDFAIWPRT